MRVARLSVVLICVAALGAMGYLALGRASPPRPVFTRTPAARTESRSATFAYRVALRRPRFRCSLDGRRYTRCRARYRVAGLADGRHRFCVRARSGARRSRTACYAWRVGRAGAPSAAFRMFAAATAPLLPGGAAIPVDIEFTNPNATPITVTAAAVAIAGSEPGPCARAIRVVGALAAQPVVPAASTRSLSQLGVPRERWPQLAMVDDGTDQTSCAGATIALALTGTAVG